MTRLAWMRLRYPPRPTPDAGHAERMNYMYDQIDTHITWILLMLAITLINLAVLLVRSI